MKTLTQAPKAKLYYLLTKPGIIMGNLMTTTGGFFLASKEGINGVLFIATLLGLALVIGSACVVNNMIDKEADQKMVRTKQRPLAQGTIQIKEAIIFSVALGIAGFIILALFTTPLALTCGLMGFLFYVFLYTLSKYRSVYGTLIGSVAGALPPLVGYYAVQPHLDLGGLLLFLILVFWQMPHFYAIAIYRQRDYAAASIPVLPVKKGVLTTQKHIVFYTAVFPLTLVALFWYHYVGLFYLQVTLPLSLGWLMLALSGFWFKNIQRWAYYIFLYSLFLITALSLMMIFSKIHVIPFAKNKFINLTRRHHQFLCLEQATIAEWQGAREDQKFVAKPTQSNMNLFFANGII